MPAAKNLRFSQTTAAAESGLLCLADPVSLSQSPNMLSFLAGALLLQTSGPLLADPVERSHPWSPGSWTGGSVTRMVSSELVGRLYRDVVVLEGSDAVLSFAPATFRMRRHLATGISDLVNLRDSGSNGTDALFMADAQGWQTLWMDQTATTLIQSNSVADSAWIGAKSLIAADGYGPLESVAALNANGTQILLVQDPTGSAAPFTISGLGGTGLALVAVDILGIGRDQIGLLHSNGLELWDPLSPSSAIASFSLGTSVVSGSMAAFSQGDPNSSSERIAVAFTGTDGASDLWVIDLLSSENLVLAYGAGSTTISSPYAVASADFDADGRGDLLVSHRDPTIPGPVVFTNACTSNVFGPCSTFPASGAYVSTIPNAWANPSGQQAAPALDDLTSDGDVDIAWFTEENSELLIAENPLMDHESMKLDFDRSTLTTYRYTGTIPYDYQDDSSDIDIDFLAPALLPNFAPNGVILEKWYQADLGSDRTLNSQSLGSEIFTQVVHPVPVWPLGASFNLFPCGFEQAGVLHMSVRQARLSNGIPVQAGPAAIFSIGMDNDANADLDVFLMEFGLPYSSLTEVVSEGTCPPSSELNENGLIFGPTSSPGSHSGSGGGRPPEPPDGDDEPTGPGVTVP